jgi:hypothetical protein
LIIFFEQRPEFISVAVRDTTFFNYRELEVTLAEAKKKILLPVFCRIELLNQNVKLNWESMINIQKASS